MIGQLISGRYKIEDAIGRGGMSDVYKAWDQQRAVHLAIKVLREDLAQDRIFLRRFQREAHTLEKLQHPNIVRFYGIGQDKQLVYLLMEYIQGETLQARIFENANFLCEHNLVGEVMQSVCSALYFAHQMGMVHCDIKPGNIMIDADGRVLLTDFGISRMTDTATATMVGFGTPAYMAPELVRGKDPTPQSDLYSLGVVLYEMVTGGERPFTGERAQTTGMTSEKVRWEQVHLAPPLPRDYKQDISPALEAVILQCLAKDPADRFTSALDLLNGYQLAIRNTQKDLQQVEESEPDSQQLTMDRNTNSPLQVEALSESSILNVSSDNDKSSKHYRSWCLWVGGLLLFFILLAAGSQLLSASRVGYPSTQSIQLTGTEAANDWTQNDNKQGMSNPTKRITNEPNLGIGSTMVNTTDGARMVFVPAGEFMMGSDKSNEKPEHLVYIDAFWIYQTQVTNTFYRKCIEAGSCEGSLSRYVENDYPAVNINWFQANAYCEWAGGRLPTEAEWEKAARGDDGRIYPWGNEEPTCDLANYLGCVGGRQKDGTMIDGTMPVGSYPEGASPYGALDMAGNVWEWVADRYDQDYYSQSPYPNPKGPETGQYRVLRGGAWGFAIDFLPTTYRYRSNPSSPDYGGFRCVQGFSP